MLLGLLVLVVLSVLLVPVHYRIDLKKEQETMCRVRVTWAGVVLRIFVEYAQGTVTQKIRIFGISCQRKKKRAGRKKDSAAADSADHEGYDGEEPQNAIDGDSVSSDAVSSDAETPKSGKPKEDEPAPEDSASKKRGKRLHFIRRLDRIKLSAKEKLHKVTVTGEFAKDEATREFLKLLWSQIVYFWKHIRPHRIRGWVHFGTGDPCHTGMLLGAISSLYGMLPPQLAIRPDFEEKILETELFVAGRLRLVTAVIIAGRVFLGQTWKAFRARQRRWKENV